MKLVNRQIDSTMFNLKLVSVSLLAIGLVACGSDSTTPAASVVAPVVMNDTGVSLCADQLEEGLVCATTAATHPRQDANLGRDASVATNSNADGAFGFSFTNIGTDCVTDNVTGLVWELKTAVVEDRATVAAPLNLRANTNTYTWYDSSRAHAAGDRGVANGGTCIGEVNEVSVSCDTEGYVNAINQTALCGFTDWRLPSRAELQSIVDYSHDEPGPLIDTGYFPNAHNTDSVHGLHRDWYWSSQTAAGYAKYAWAISLNTGGDTQMAKHTTQLIRLVRGGS